MVMTRFLALLLAALLPHIAQAQSWPSRPVKFILSLGPGSGADITGRMLAERLGKQWGQPVVVENRPGADAVLAINAVIAAKDDHTLLYGPSSAFVGHPYTLDKVPYDRNELVPVARVSNTVVVLAVPTALKVQTLKELMQMVREEPGKLNYASVAQLYDIMMAAYLKGAGLEMQRVTYKDAVSAQNDLVEGRIQLYSAAYAIVRGHVQGGRIRVLAVQNRSTGSSASLPPARAGSAMRRESASQPT
jgi:tripartite-type tricarboxylate transporter receptor subunit TctC